MNEVDTKPVVLIVSEHASNRFGGEAILPYNYYKYLSKESSVVYLLTHERVKKHLDKDTSIDVKNIYYIPDTIVHIMLHKLGRLLPIRIASVTTGALSHIITQLYQWILARKLIKEKGVNIIHEPAPVSPKQPSMMFMLGVRVIIGPMNGGMDFPPAFRFMSSYTERLLFPLLRYTSTLVNILIPGKLFADALLVSNEKTREALPVFRFGDVIEFVENGVYSENLLTNKVKRTCVSAELIFVGRLVDLKAVDIIIDAMLIVKTKNVHMSIVGDGPERKKLEDQAKTNNVSVSFHGVVPHADVVKYYDRSDVFLLPSLHECGGAVVLEAMARGLPVIATKWGGPIDYITPETGVLVEPLSRDYLVKTFAEQIDRLLMEPELRTKMGEAGLDRVKEHYLWEKKITDINEIYTHYHNI